MSLRFTLQRQVGVTSTIALVLLGIGVPWSAAAAPACDGWMATIVGTGGDDDIVGTEDDDVIVAGPGDDVVRALGGRVSGVLWPRSVRDRGAPIADGGRGVKSPTRCCT